MKHPQGSLIDQQVRDTFFVVPEIASIYTLALGVYGYHSFQANRQRLRAAGGDLLLIGWPDGTTITYSRDDRTAPLNLDTLADTYRASATLFHIANPKASA
jgi:hypothetical protein